jgi:hypothetical protein
VIARELRIECDPFFGDASIPDISASAPYTKKHRRLPRGPAAAIEQGEKDAQQSGLAEGAKGPQGAFQVSNVLQ